MAPKPTHCQAMLIVARGQPWLDMISALSTVKATSKAASRINPAKADIRLSTDQDGQQPADADNQRHHDPGRAHTQLRRALAGDQRRGDEQRHEPGQRDRFPGERISNPFRRTASGTRR